MHSGVVAQFVRMSETRVSRIGGLDVGGVPRSADYVCPSSAGRHHQAQNESDDTDDHQHDTDGGDVDPADLLK
jgi:hypothetical protein